MSMIEIIVPVAEPRVQQKPLSARRENLTGRIAWLDNLKANAGTLLRGVERGLRTGGDHFESIHITKNATAAAPDEVMAHLKTCDAVVLAIAD